MKLILEELHDKKHNILSHEQGNPKIKSVVYDFQPISTCHTDKEVNLNIVCQFIYHFSVFRSTVQSLLLLKNGSDVFFLCMENDFVSCPL